MLFDTDESESTETERHKRVRQPYKTATARPKTRREIEADQTSLLGDLFGLEEVSSKTSLTDLYGTMEEVHKVKGTNGLKAISLFSGSGLSQTGFAWSGWEDVLSVEFIRSARETIGRNYDSLSIEPETVTKVALAWLEKNEIGISVSIARQKKLKGAVYEPAIDWALTMDTIFHPKISEDERERLNLALDRFRYEVNIEVFTTVKSVIKEGHLPVWGDDIRFFSAKAFMEVFGIEKGQIDCLEGSPPCKSFSMSGVREKGWGEIVKYSEERDQRTDDLFFEYFRVLRDVMPKSFIAENVGGLIVGEARDSMLIPLLEAFDDLGYRVDYKLIKANEYGVPQIRPRVFIVGVRKDLIDKRTGKYSYPKFPEKYQESFTLQDVFDAAANHPVDEENLKWASIVGSEAGKTWGLLSPGQAPENKQYQITRCHPNMPVPTVTQTDAKNAASAGPLHPYEPRKFTIQEYLYIFGAPHDYKLAGDYGQQGERLGRSVAPFVMKQLSGEIAKVLLNSESDPEILKSIIGN